MSERVRGGTAGLVFLALLLLIIAGGAGSGQANCPCRQAWANFGEMPEAAQGAWLNYVERNPGWIEVFACGLVSEGGYTAWLAGVLDPAEVYRQGVMFAELDGWWGEDRCPAIIEAFDMREPASVNFSAWKVVEWLLAYYDAERVPLGVCSWEPGAFECVDADGAVVPWEELAEQAVYWGE